MAEIGEKMTNATPEENAAKRSQITYEINAAQMVKNQGNELHSQGRYKEASQKYLLAKKNLKGILASNGRSKKKLKGILASNGRTILSACSLNLMLCYLKTRQYDDCIEEGNEVLAYDAKNVKALYRRGQAYKELGLLKAAVSDLRKAHEVSPDDKSIADGLRSFQNLMSHADSETLAALSSGKAEGISPDMFKTASNMSSKGKIQRDPTDSNSNSFGPGLVPPNMTLDMSAEELQRIFQMALSLQGKDSASLHSNELRSDTVSRPRVARGSSTFNGIRIGESSSSSQFLNSTSPFQSSSPNSTSDLQEQMKYPAMRQITSMIKNMNPYMMANMSELFGLKLSREDAEKVQQAMSSTVHGLDIMVHGLDTMITSMIKNMNPDMMAIMSELFGFKLSREDAEKVQQAMSSTVHGLDIMVHGLDTMMLTSMIKKMNPDMMMANMSEQFGFKLSWENAEKVQQAMSSMVHGLDTMMKWADRLQRGVEGARKTKNWLLGRLQRGVEGARKTKNWLLGRLQRGVEGARKTKNWLLGRPGLILAMKWADRLQRGVEGARKTKNWLLGRLQRGVKGARKTKNWLLGRPGLILAMKWADRLQRGVEGARKTKNWLLCMLILYVIFHWLGFIGS